MMTWWLAGLTQHCVQPTLAGALHLWQGSDDWRGWCFFIRLGEHVAMCEVWNHMCGRDSLVIVDLYNNPA